MKMENEIRSTQAGRIEAVGVQAGQTVSQGDMLVKIGSGDGA
jgi:biotin carboxyl carrier protein